MASLPLSILDACESPIERKLGAALLFVFDTFFPPDSVTLVPQYLLANYRYDFAIVFIGQLETYNGNGLVFLIECDGKEFHGDKELDRDVAKDRLAIEVGSHCLRYRGSDIYINPYLIADEIRRAVEYMRNWALGRSRTPRFTPMNRRM